MDNALGKKLEIVVDGMIAQISDDENVAARAADMLAEAEQNGTVINAHEMSRIAAYITVTGVARIVVSRDNAGCLQMFASRLRDVPAIKAQTADTNGDLAVIAALIESSNTLGGLGGRILVEKEQ